MRKNIRTIIAVTAMVLTLGGATYALASKACCVEPEWNSCCVNTATSDCCR